MTKKYTSMLFLPFSLDAASLIPLHRQLYQGIRQAILMGQLAADTQLPSTRELASRLNISRTTIVQAFEQLLSEGYLQGRAGSGTYVASVLPEDVMYKPVSVRKQRPVFSNPQKEPRLSQRGSSLVNASITTPLDKFPERAFRPGMPDLESFPFDTWTRLATQRWRNLPRTLLGYGHTAGYHPLRSAIAEYLAAARGVLCTAEQVIIVSGSQQGINLAARMLLDPGDAVWIENPGYPGARSAFIAASARLVPIPVDEEGLNVTAGRAQGADARMAYVTPSCQFPLGMTMSPARRTQLLEWARHNNTWIVEDDYDSEFRYAGSPIAALQGLDTTGHVIYIGTFSKVLFPALRLGYLIVPSDLVDAFTAARTTADLHSPALDQIVLTDFLTQGHFARHMRRMRSLYAERQAYLVESVRKELSGLLTVRPSKQVCILLARLTMVPTTT